MVRGGAGAESDVGLMVDMEPGASLFGMAGFGYDCGRLLGVHVDVVPRETVGEIDDQAFAENIQTEANAL